MLPARDGTALLFRVEQFYGVALGVLKDVDAENGLVAILGMNAYLFDIMPTELREHSEVLLELSDGKPVADYRLPAGATRLRWHHRLRHGVRAIPAPHCDPGRRGGIRAMESRSRIFRS